MVVMISSAEVAILTKVADLAKRCGMKASEADGSLDFVDENSDPEGKSYYFLDFGSTPPGKEAEEKMEKFMGLLGLKDTCTLKGELEDFEDILDHALSMAPRARSY
jgi:hypothetical protein